MGLSPRSWESRGFCSERSLIVSVSIQYKTVLAHRKKTADLREGFFCAPILETAALRVNSFLSAASGTFRLIQQKSHD